MAFVDRAIDRRGFLSVAGGALAASATLPRNLYGAAEDLTPAPRGDGRLAMTFWDPVDVLICGSTLFACDLAVQSAKSGRRTLLVMDKVNPFFEGVTCLRSWVKANEIPELIRGVATHPATSEVKAGKVYFNAMKAALDIEDQLCEAGVRFFYNASVAGAIAQAGQLAGAVFGGKTGLFAVEAGAVVDATADATLARAAGAKSVPQTGPRRYHYVADLAKPVPPRTAGYTAENGARVSVEIHHYYACFDVELDSHATGPFAWADDFTQVYAACLECKWEGDEKRFRGADGYLSSGIDRMDLPNGRVEGIENLLVFGPQAVPGNTEGSLVLKDPNALFAAFPSTLEQIKSAARPVASPRPVYEFWNKGVPRDSSPPPGMVHGFSDHGFDEPGTSVADVVFHPPQPALAADVLVVGGGTSGNAAAYASARLGMKTVCLERSLELGGTNTIGGVTKLWFGNKTKAFSDYYDAIGARNDGLNAPDFFHGVRKAGCRVLMQSAVTGVARLGRMIERVYVITPMGLTAVESPRWMDATGDGSLAAWAGCGYSFGGEHDEATLWASFAGFRPGHQEALRTYLSTCDERSPLDTTRFILAMRRNSKISLDQKHVPPPFYVAPRESRHIRGGKTLTYLDALAGRRFRDGVFRVEANPDIKGIATSDAAKAGFIPTNRVAIYQATVPYAAMIPNGIDNVIIAGKAYSATHDALSLARMQRDMCVMGMVAAEAVRLAAARKALLRDIPIKVLQETLIAKQMLRAEDVAEDDFGFAAPPEALAGKVAASETMDSAMAESAMLCLLPREAALAAMEAYGSSSNPAVHRVLCFLGSPTGMDAYLAQVETALNEDPLSKEPFGGKGTPHIMPDQGYAPTAALMLGSLAHARQRRAVPLLAKLAGRIDLTVDDLSYTWGYTFALACGLERLACSGGIGPLRRVLAGTILSGRIVSRSDDLRRTKDYVGERYAYLRMALSRALARCGDPDGALELCAFLNESRVCLARAARAELVAATGRDFRFDAEQWRLWIEQHGNELKPNPLNQPLG